jgi:phenylpropionate dioxygenase-like ring-hydroxylating dioxygenase large terminal subunit
MFIRNAWYVAADEHEIGDRPVARTILGEDVVLYQQRDGVYAALQNACPHRKARLSAGKVTSLGLQCGYHGLTYDRNGKCVVAPGEDRIPHLAAVRAYPVAAKYGWLWIWMGDLAAARSRPIAPMLEPYFTAQWVHARGYHFVACHYELINDNLLDLSHADFVHGGVLGDERRGIAGRSAVNTKVQGNTVVMSRWDYDDTPPPFVVPMLNSTGNVDWWRIMTWEAPGVMLLDVGACRAGSRPEEGRKLINTDLVTPATQTTTHYFWTTARSFEIEDPEWTERLRAMTRTAFDQDQSMIEGQQVALANQDIRSLRLATTRNDLPVYRAREIVERMLREEQDALEPARRAGAT